MLSNKLGIYITLPYTFNIKNAVHLMKDLLEIPYDQNLKRKKNKPKLCIIDYILMLC
jgi:hypothetical protein